MEVRTGALRAKASGAYPRSTLRKSAYGEAEDLAEMEVVEPPVSYVDGMPRSHKVISYGTRVMIEDSVPVPYRFQYMPEPDAGEVLEVGNIPDGFVAEIAIGDVIVSMRTRQSISCANPEFCFQVTQGTQPETSAELGMKWDTNLLLLWDEFLNDLEVNEILTQEGLSSLDGDPLWLFGVADPQTQDAIADTFTEVVAVEDEEMEFQTRSESKILAECDVQLAVLAEKQRQLEAQWQQQHTASPGSPLSPQRGRSRDPSPLRHIAKHRMGSHESRVSFDDSQLAIRDASKSPRSRSPTRTAPSEIVAVESDEDSLEDNCDFERDSKLIGGVEDAVLAEDLPSKEIFGQRFDMKASEEAVQQRYQPVTKHYKKPVKGTSKALAHRMIGPPSQKSLKGLAVSTTGVGGAIRKNVEKQEKMSQSPSGSPLAMSINASRTQSMLRSPHASRTGSMSPPAIPAPPVRGLGSGQQSPARSRAESASTVTRR
jgi:hypothetical protein